MICSEVNASRSSNGKQLPRYITKGPLWFSTHYWPVTHSSFQGPGAGCWEFFFPFFCTQTSSLFWIPLLGNMRLVGKKNLQGKVLVFALGWKSDTINENNNWTLWAWIGMKHNTKSMFVIPIVIVKCLWRALCNVHSSISSFFVCLLVCSVLFLTQILPFALSLPSPSDQEKGKRKRETAHITDWLWEASFREPSELGYKSISLSNATTTRVKERNEVISRPSA